MRSRWPATACLAAVLGWTGAAAAQGGGVNVAVDQFGVGSVHRPGEMVGVRVVLTSDLDEPTPCWVQWEMPNAEGDIAELGRSITVGPGIPTRLWLYAPLPPNTSISSVWRVRVFEERDGRPTRELGSTRISPSPTAIDLATGLIGVVGRLDMNLPEYDVPGGPWQSLTPPGAHERTRTVAGIAPIDLPDRWWGLKPFEAIAWSNAQPQNLRSDPAKALREWIRRGGHLIINLPQAGNPWGLGTLGQTYLDDLLPGAAPRTDEGVKLSEIMHVLSKTDEPRRELDLSIRVFKEIGGAYDVLDNHYEPLIALADGRVVVIRRTYGFGRVTISGIDLSGQLRALGLPEADVFWNRVLGRRADTPQASVLIQMQTTEPPRLRRRSPNQLTIGDGRLVEQHLNKQRRAEAGLLLALVLFAAYLLIAGPGGFFALKQRGLERHSWLAFAATAAVFTAIAWGGARVLRGTQGTELRHVTILDHVARPADDARLGEPQLQRATMFGVLYVPGYGTADIAIDSDAERADLLTAWTAPEKTLQTFPNVSNYRVDLGRSPAAYSIPVRATATQCTANWLGVLDPAWGGLIRVDPADPVRVETDTAGVLQLQGSLISDLPGTLTDVAITWVTNRRGPRLTNEWENELEHVWTAPPRAQHGRPLLNAGYAARAPSWDPGTRLSLAREVRADPKERLGVSLYRRYVKDEEPDRFMGGQQGGRITERQARMYLEMLGFFHHLTPPKYHRIDEKDPETVVFTRKLGRELDLSAWYSRPCLIVTGFLANSETPVPFTVYGRRPPRNVGLTMVRWIYPLPLEEAEVVPGFFE